TTVPLFFILRESGLFSFMTPKTNRTWTFDLRACFENVLQSERGVYAASTSRGFAGRSGINAALRVFSKHDLNLSADQRSMARRRKSWGDWSIGRTTI